MTSQESLLASSIVLEMTTVSNLGSLDPERFVAKLLSRTEINQGTGNKKRVRELIQDQEAPSFLSIFDKKSSQKQILDN